MVVGTKMAKHFYLQPHKSCLYLYLPKNEEHKEEMLQRSDAPRRKDWLPDRVCLKTSRNVDWSLGSGMGVERAGGGRRDASPQWGIRRGRLQTTGSRSQASRGNAGRDAEPRKFETAPGPENYPDSGSGSEQNVLAAPVPAWTPGKMYRVRRLRLRGCEVF